MTNLKQFDIEIIECIINNQGIKQSELSQRFNINKSNISRKCKTFKDLNILLDNSHLQFNPTFVTNLIIEIQYNNIRYFLADSFGEILSDQFNISYNNEISLQVALSNVLEYFDEKSYDCIGCVVHSQIQNNKISHFHNSDIKDFPIHDYLSTLTDKNIYIENFSNAAALTHFMTSHSECHSLFFLRTSPGLGAGLVYHGKIFHGFNGSAMEPGCTLFDSDEPGIYNRSFEKYEHELSSSTDILNEELLIDYLANLNLVLKIVKSFVDPEIIVIDSNLLKNNPKLLFRIPFEGIEPSHLANDNCYKSICQIILQAETSITYKHF